MRQWRTRWPRSAPCCGRSRSYRRSSSPIAQSPPRASRASSCCQSSPSLLSLHGADMCRIWGVASWFLGAYIVSQRLSIPLQVQPQAFGFLSGLSWVQTLYYSKGYSKMKAGLCLLGFCILFAGFETGSVYALWVSPAWTVCFSYRS